jgi:hypothetical protein
MDSERGVVAANMNNRRPVSENRIRLKWTKVDSFSKFTVCIVYSRKLRKRA